MELLIIILIVGFILLARANKDGAITKWLKNKPSQPTNAPLWLNNNSPTNTKTPVDEPEIETHPAPDEETPLGPEFSNGNIQIIWAEIRESPDPELIHKFPNYPNAITRFEEFNRRLFVLEISKDRKEEGEDNFEWLDTHDNDYPTIITGTRKWALKQVKERLRTGYPVLYDPFGWWKDASDNLEIDPLYEDAVVNAYLSLPHNIRPVVITQNRTGQKPKDIKENELVLFRYGFKDFDFPIKFLKDYPEDILEKLLMYFVAKPETWESFSPARLVKLIIDEKIKEAEAESAMDAHRRKIREEQYKNRFAALWNLRNTAQNEKKAEEASSEETAA